MTIDEASERYNIPMEILREYRMAFGLILAAAAFAGSPGLLRLAAPASRKLALNAAHHLAADKGSNDPALRHRSGRHGIHHGNQKQAALIDRKGASDHDK